MEMNFKMDKIGLGTEMNVDMGNISQYEKYESQYGEANVRIKKIWREYGDENIICPVTGGELVYTDKK